MAKKADRDSLVDKTRLLIRPYRSVGKAIGDPKKFGIKHADTVCDGPISEQTVERADDREIGRAEGVEFGLTEGIEIGKQLAREALQAAPTPAPPLPVPETTAPAPEAVPEAVPEAPPSPAKQQKLAVLEARLAKRLEAIFEDRVLAEVHKRIEENVLPYYKEQLETAEMVMKAGKPFTNKEYLSILMAFHPDTSTHENRTATFRLIKEREVLLRPEEKDKPLTSRLPKTLPDILKKTSRTRGSRKNASETV